MNTYVRKIQTRMNYSTMLFGFTQASVLYAVPPVVLLLGQNALVTKDHFSRLRFMINGAGPVSADDAERLIARTNNNFRFCQGE